MLFAYTRVFNSGTFLWDTNDKLYLAARTNTRLHCSLCALLVSRQGASLQNFPEQKNPHKALPEEASKRGGEY